MVNLGRNVIAYDPSNKYNGVFQFLKNISEKFTFDDFVNISSNDYWIGNNFCGFDVEGQPPSCLIDGTMNTAWRNGLGSNNFFDID